MHLTAPGGELQDARAQADKDEHASDRCSSQIVWPSKTTQHISSAGWRLQGGKRIYKLSMFNMRIFNTIIHSVFDTYASEMVAY